MSEPKDKKEKPQPVDTSHINKVYIYTLALSAMFGPIYWGYVIGVVAPTQEYLKDQVYADQPSAVLYLSIAIKNIGGFIAGILATMISQKKGRRITLMISDVVAIFSAGFAVLPHISLFIIGRILMGVHTGSNYTIVPNYLSEWSPPEVKGRVGSFTTLGECLGVLFGYLLGLNMPIDPQNADDDWWRVMYGLGAIFPLIRLLLLGFVFRLDTPVNLMKNEQLDKAEQAYCKIYKGEHGPRMFKQSLRQMKATQTVVAKDFERRGKRKRSGILDMLQQKKYRKATVYGGILTAVVYFSGYVYILNYATSIFKESSDDPLDRTPVIFTIILGAVSLCTSFLAGFVLNRFGRKTILIVGFLLISICHFTFMGINIRDPNSEALKYLVILSVALYVLTLGACQYVYLGDILKGPAFSIINVVAALSAFSITFVSPIIQENLGPVGTFAVFGGGCTIGLIFTIFFLKETKGKSYFETLNIFNGALDIKNGSFSPKKLLSRKWSRLSATAKVTPLQKGGHTPAKSIDKSTGNAKPFGFLPEDEKVPTSMQVIKEEDAVSIDPEYLEQTEMDDLLQDGDLLKNTNREAPNSTERQLAQEADDKGSVEKQGGGQMNEVHLNDDPKTVADVQQKEQNTPREEQMTKEEMLIIRMRKAKRNTTRIIC